jgi:hypothetical protein
MGTWVHPACEGLGWILGDIGVDLSLSDVVMTWSRLQTPMDCIPHPYLMYAKCFTTLICYGWAYGSTLTLHCYACAGWGQIFRDVGDVLSLSDGVMSWLWLT